jgi:hypothetical protein
MAPPLLEELNKHYESSLKAFLGAVLELELSMQLVLSFFECKDTDEQDEQELQTLYTLSWEPVAMSVFLVYGHRVLPRIAPAPENEDRNMLRLKILTWVYSLLFLVWDDDMTVKSGPALGIAIIFCVCDLARFQMEVHRLIDDYTDDEEDESDIEYAVHMLGLDNTAGTSTSGDHPPSKAAESSHVRISNANTTTQAAPLPTWSAPVREMAAASGSTARLSLSLGQDPPHRVVPGGASQRPVLQPYRNKSNRYLLKKSSSNVNAVGLDTTPSNINSEFVAVVDERDARAGADAKGELVAKNSFVYEF